MISLSRAVVAAAVVAAGVGIARPAHAVLGKTCHLGGDPNVPWFNPRTTVDVWVTTNAALNPMTATGQPQVQFENAVRKSVNILNEEGGTSLKLRYRGTTTSTVITNAVVVTGRVDVCDGALAKAFPQLTGSNTYFRGTVEFRKFAGGSCAPIAWTTSILGGGNDIVAVLNQELIHQVYNVAHPQDAPINPDCEDFGQPSVMRMPSRVLSNWDLEVIQGRYGPRAQYSRFFRSKMTGAASWQTAFEATGMSFLRPLYRPGSISQRSTEPWFGWVYAFDNGVQAGGTGRADVNRYMAGSQSWNLMTAPDGTFGRPVAVAYKPPTASGAELLLAYQKVAAGNTIYSSTRGQICYRKSVNNGVSWSFETCPATAFATTYGLAAAWDAYSNAFVIGFSQTSPGHTFELAALTVPATGSATPSVVSFLGVASPHGPGIACGGVATSSNCLFAYETADTSGLLGYTRVSINPTTGAATKGTVFSQGWLIYDTPSVIYVPQDTTFRLAYTVASAAIYSYKMHAVTGTSWTGTGDIFNNASAHVSTVVLAARLGADGSSIFPYGWFIKYW